MAHPFSTLIFVILSVSISGQVLAESLCKSALSERSLNGDLSWARQSALRDLADLRSSIQRGAMLSNDHEKVGQFVTEDTRRVLFRLQGLSHLYEGEGGGFFAKKRAFFKVLEDQLGELSMLDGLIKTATVLRQTEIELYFTKRRIKSEEKLIDRLKSEGLWENSQTGLARLDAEFSKRFESSGATDRDFILKQIRADLESLQRDVADSKFDAKKIEDGLHELRRRLRWILINLQSFEGFIMVTDDRPLPSAAQKIYDQLETENPLILQSKYLIQSSAKVANYIRISLKPYAILAELVVEIGLKKDAAEAQIQFREAALALGYKPSAIAKLESQLNQFLKTEPVDHRELAREYQRMILEGDLLRIMRKSMKD